MKYWLLSYLAAAVTQQGKFGPTYKFVNGSVEKIPPNLIFLIFITKITQWGEVKKCSIVSGRAIYWFLSFPLGHPSPKKQLVEPQCTWRGWFLSLFVKASEKTPLTFV